VSTLHHALQGSEISAVYLRDAESEGDGDAAKYSRHIQSQYLKMAERAKELLSKRIK
jgi:hypothetical protein